MLHHNYGKNKYSTWTPAEEMDLLRIIYIDNLTYVKASHKLGRTSSACQSRISKLRKENKLNPMLEKLKSILKSESDIV